MIFRFLPPPAFTMPGSLCMGEEAYSFLSQAVHNMWMFVLTMPIITLEKTFVNPLQKILIRMQGRF